MDTKQAAILNGLMRDGLIHSWALTYDSYDEWRVTLDEDDENAPEVGLPTDDYAEWLTYESLPWWLLADDWEPKP